MAGPLTGVRVIDLTTVGMGPYATQMLGDMGADVIKVEAPAGDPFRDIAPAINPRMGAPFLNLNRNKRSIVLDLKQAAGRETLDVLLAGADLFVCNIRPQALRKLGLDYPSLEERFPRLIYCSLQGFSEHGPYAGRPAFDDVIQAMSGMAALQGHHSGEPEYVNAIIADKVTGLAAVGAIGMALYERERSGKGQAIEVPMFEFMVSFNQVEHMASATFSRTEGAGYARVLSPNRRPYRTRDGHISVLPYTTDHWVRFFRSAGRPELAEEAARTDPLVRSRDIDRWYKLLADIVAERPTDEWLRLLADADIPLAPILSLDELLQDERLTEAGAFVRHAHPTEGEILSSGIPISFSRTPGSVRMLAPGLDEHHDEILEECAGEGQAGPSDGSGALPVGRETGEVQ